MRLPILLLFLALTAAAQDNAEDAKKAADAKSEIMGNCTQIGAKLGGEIAQEIEKEYPEWDSANHNNAKEKQ